MFVCVCACVHRHMHVYECVCVYVLRECVCAIHTCTCMSYDVLTPRVIVSSYHCTVHLPACCNTGFKWLHFCALYCWIIRKFPSSHPVHACMHVCICVVGWCWLLHVVALVTSLMAKHQQQQIRRADHQICNHSSLKPQRPNLQGRRLWRQPLFQAESMTCNRQSRWNLLHQWTQSSPSSYPNRTAI